MNKPVCLRENSSLVFPIGDSLPYTALAFLHSSHHNVNTLNSSNYVISYTSYYHVYN